MDCRTVRKGELAMKAKLVHTEEKALQALRDGYDLAVVLLSGNNQGSGMKPHSLWLAKRQAAKRIRKLQKEGSEEAAIEGFTAFHFKTFWTLAIMKGNSAHGAKLKEALPGIVVVNRGKWRYDRRCKLAPLRYPFFEHIYLYLSGRRRIACKSQEQATRLVAKAGLKEATAKRLTAEIAELLLPATTVEADELEAQAQRGDKELALRRLAERVGDALKRPEGKEKPPTVRTFINVGGTGREITE